MQKKLLVSVASIVSIITATTTSADDSSESERLRSENRRNLELLREPAGHLPLGKAASDLSAPSSPRALDASTSLAQLSRAI